MSSRLIPRPRPAFHRLQYGKALRGESLGTSSTQPCNYPVLSFVPKSSPTRAGTIFQYIDISQYSLARYDIISIPSVQLTIWQVKVHVCFYCACSEQLPPGFVRALTASWLCTMAANAGASENRIVPNKQSDLSFVQFGVAIFA